jgi:hypothetical protein
MMRHHAVEVALDLMRMPILARAAAAPPIPPDVVELMQIAAASPQACAAAAAATGESVEVVIEAARFYLQHLLFKPEADCYRILGLGPRDTRATARIHMRWLLQWLHPDRNDGLEAVYAQRVVKAWHEISARDEAGRWPSVHAVSSASGDRAAPPFRLPLFKLGPKRSSQRRRWLRRPAWLLSPGVVRLPLLLVLLLLLLVMLWSATYFLGAAHPPTLLAWP